MPKYERERDGKRAKNDCVVKKFIGWTNFNLPFI